MANLNHLSGHCLIVNNGKIKKARHRDFFKVKSFLNLQNNKNIVLYENYTHRFSVWKPETWKNLSLDALIISQAWGHQGCSWCVLSLSVATFQVGVVYSTQVL